MSEVKIPIKVDLDGWHQIDLMVYVEAEASYDPGTITGFPGECYPPSSDLNYLITGFYWSSPDGGGVLIKAKQSKEWDAFIIDFIKPVLRGYEDQIFEQALQDEGNRNDWSDPRI